MAKSVKASLTNVNEKIDVVTERAKMSGNSDSARSNEANTYANALKSNKNVVIIRPKSNDVQSKATRKKVQECIDPTSDGVSYMGNIRRGGVAVTCRDEQSMRKVKETMEKLSNEFSVDVAKRRNPKIKIVGLSEELDNDTICNKIRAQNEWAADANTLKLLKTYSVNDKYFSAIVEVDPKMFDKCMRSKCVNIGWDRCKVYEQVNVLMCLKCCGYNHLAKDCKHKEACRKCSGEHKTAVCTSNAEKCINCVTANMKYKLKLDVNHHVHSTECEVRKRKVENAKRSITLAQ